MSLFPLTIALIFFTVTFGGQGTGCQILKIIYVNGTLSQHRHTKPVVCGISVIDLNNLIVLTGELVVLSYSELTRILADNH